MYICICTYKYLGLDVFMCMCGHICIYVYGHICIYVDNLLVSKRLIGFSPPKKEGTCMYVHISAGYVHFSAGSLHIVPLRSEGSVNFQVTFAKTPC